MWQAAGASILNMPSNEVYNALADGRLRGDRHLDRSLVSFRIDEHVKRVTAPGGKLCGS